ncbi:MAG: phosphoglycerate dehydrogenase [Spirochaetota bacterium]
MFHIQTFNKISDKGLSYLTEDEFRVGPDVDDPDAILLRSQKLHDMEFNPRLKAIARAGAGVNNIPVDRCTESGVVVFNTPGANANSVKELVISGLFLSSRRIHEGLRWVESVDEPAEVATLVEKQKASFAGPEVAGKTLGVVGLGAIGVMVANAAIALDMEVIGYDPYLSVESAWGLSRTVRRANKLESLLAESDYITLHVPLNDATEQMIDHGALTNVKRGARLLNFARGGLVDSKAVLAALEQGVLDRYVTDFPEPELIRNERVLAIPHLGASTPEAEENCAVMAARQLRAFLQTGNIVNSVNFPDCEVQETDKTRIVIANRNIPNMVGQYTTILAAEGINILDLLNRHRDEVAYNIIDLDRRPGKEALDSIRAIDGVIRVREIDGE